MNYLYASLHVMERGCTIFKDEGNANKHALSRMGCTMSPEKTSTFPFAALSSVPKGPEPCSRVLWVPWTTSDFSHCPGRLSGHWEAFSPKQVPSCSPEADTQVGITGWSRSQVNAYLGLQVHKAHSSKQLSGRPFPAGFPSFLVSSPYDSSLCSDGLK